MVLPTHLNIRTNWVCNNIEVFLVLDALAKLLKATISFFMSVRLYVRRSHGTSRFPLEGFS